MARVYDVPTEQLVATLGGHTNFVTSVAFSPDGKSVVTGSRDGTARVGRADGGLPVVVLSGHSASVVDAGFSPDGRAVVTLDEDGTARIWDAGTEPHLSVLGVERGPVADAELSHTRLRLRE